jgi:hypothetical protein
MTVKTGMAAMEINIARNHALLAGADLGLHNFIIAHPVRETVITCNKRLEISSADLIFVPREYRSIVYFTS